ncbi:MAG: lysylphosphatidylglycerol synthase transmembrane domain-containing protein [Pseudomonadota bacterium]
MHVVVPVALIAFIVSTVGAGDVLARLGAADPVWILAAIAAATAQMFLSSLRWRLTAARLGAGLRYRDAVSEYYLSSIINSTVPGAVVGDALRVVRTRAAAGLERAAQAVIIERLAGQVALGATLIAGLALSGHAVLEGSAAVAAAIVLAVLGLLFLLRGGIASRLMPAVGQRFLMAIRLSWFGRSTALFQIVLSLLVVAANLAGFVFAARATGAIIGFPEILYAVPLILAAMLIPFSVAGWGYREGAAAAVFPWIGASAAAGVSASVLYGAVILVASLPGVLVLFAGDRGLSFGPSHSSHARVDPAE